MSQVFEVLRLLHLLVMSPECCSVVGATLRVVAQRTPPSSRNMLVRVATFSRPVLEGWNVVALRGHRVIAWLFTMNDVCADGVISKSGKDCYASSGYLGGRDKRKGRRRSVN